MSNIAFAPMSGLYRNKRTAATHILVVMISTECRSKKPYALLLQCISYVEITVKQMRDILNQVVLAMFSRGMKINGANLHVHFGIPVMYTSVCTCIYMHVYTNNIHEYSYICTENVCMHVFQDLFQMESIIVCGYTRPLSVLQIRSEARKKYSKMGFQPMMTMFTPKR